MTGRADYRPCSNCRARGFAIAGEFAYGCMRCEHTVVVLEVLGTPAPKGSSRAIMRGGFAVNVPSGSNVNRDKLKSWDVNVREAAIAFLGRDRKQPLFVNVPLLVEIEFRLARPKGHWSPKGGLRTSAPAYPFVKPDGDKLQRATWDSLTGIVFDDDSRIVKWPTGKVYATPGLEGATITVSALDER